MKQNLLYPALLIVLFLIGGCDQQSPEKIRYDMEKLVFNVGKISERINIQPELSTAEDSLLLESAYREIIDYYFEHKDNPQFTDSTVELIEIGKMALTAQTQLARFYVSQKNLDSAMAGYLRIGKEIPAARFDIAGASMALALSYRTLEIYDSTIAIYDRILAEYYPPVDDLDRVNTDLLAIPIDKIKIIDAIGDSTEYSTVIDQALGYYSRLRNDYPASLISHTASIQIGRVYSMSKQWNKAIAELEQLKDSTGQVDINAALIIANLYIDAKKDIDKGIDIYKQILERQPDSTIIGSILLRLGTAYCAKKEYEEGRKVLAELKKKFPRRTGLMTQAQLYYAQAFEQGGRWDRALSEYQWLMENYPYSQESFRTALHIPDYFREEGDEKMAGIWYDRSIEFYQTAIRNKRGQPVAMAAHTFLSDAFQRKELWNESLETLESLNRLTPKSRIGAQALYNAASVAFNKLGDSIRAQGYIDKLNQDFGSPDSIDINRKTIPETELNNIQ